MAARADLKKRLRARERLFGCWTSIGHPSITEIFTLSGVDFVGIDVEHSTISQAEARAIIAAAQAGGVACLPRVASHNGEQIRRLLDSGADGIIVPNVTTVAEVERLVEWFKYPPVGQRSFGVARAQGYGVHFDSYTKEWNERSTLLIQIESVRGVEAVEDLIAHPAVNGVLVGPYDISGSLGIPGQLDHARVREACRRVIEACRKAGKACGTQVVDPNPENVGAALAEGYRFVVLSSDVFLLWKWSERMRGLIASLRRPATAGTRTHVG